MKIIKSFDSPYFEDKEISSQEFMVDYMDCFRGRGGNDLEEQIYKLAEALGLFFSGHSKEYVFKILAQGYNENSSYSKIEIRHE